MKTSESRILTTHMGSLPRGEMLSDLLVRKDNEEAVDEGLLAREIEAAMQHVVDRQLESGVDVGNDGEQPRVSFQTYVTSRMAGFGGEGKRPMPLETKLYPKWAELLKTRRAARARVYNPPAAVAEVKYENFSGVEAECEGFRRCLAAADGEFLEPFMTAASPGVVTTTMMNHHYESHEDYLFAVAREIGKEYRYVAGQGFLLQIDAPDLAMERASFFQDLSIPEFQERSSSTSRRSISPSREYPATGCACTRAGGTGTGRIPRMWPWSTSSPTSSKRRSGRSASRSRTPATRTRSTRSGAARFPVISSQWWGSSSRRTTTSSTPRW